CQGRQFLNSYAHEGLDGHKALQDTFRFASDLLNYIDRRANVDLIEIGNLICILIIEYAMAVEGAHCFGCERQA
ncbi:MAG: hypothetical protein DIU59_016990, partial [Pseudomonadota bacterium]